MAIYALAIYVGSLYFSDISTKSRTKAAPRKLSVKSPVITFLWELKKLCSKKGADQIKLTLRDVSWMQDQTGSERINNSIIDLFSIDNEGTID